MTEALAWYKEPEYLTLIVAILAIIASAIGVIYQIHQSRKIAKRLRTLDILLSHENDQMHENGLKILRKYNEDGLSTARLGEDGLDESKRDEADTVFELLNYYEYLAVAISRNIICEKTLLKANRSTVIEIYESSKELIDRLQKNQNTVFIELTWLYNRWKSNGHYGKLPSRKKNRPKKNK